MKRLPRRYAPRNDKVRTHRNDSGNDPRNDKVEVLTI